MLPAARAHVLESSGVVVVGELDLGELARGLLDDQRINPQRHRQHDVEGLAATADVIDVGTAVLPLALGTATMKVTATTLVSVDRVLQGPGGPDQDRSGGFEHGGWDMPHVDKETMTFIKQVYQRADAFLPGWRTYEIFAAAWSAGRTSASAALEM